MKSLLLIAWTLMENTLILFGKFNGSTETLKVKPLSQLEATVELLNGQWEKALNLVILLNLKGKPILVKRTLFQVQLLMRKTKKVVWHSSTQEVSVLISQEVEVASTILLQQRIAASITVRLLIQINQWWITMAIKVQSTELDVTHSGIHKIAPFSWLALTIGQ